MSDIGIGLSGLQVAQRAIEIIGNNIANAGTEGYHRQEVVIAPIPGSTVGGLTVGGGAEVIDIRRVMNLLLDNEIRQQRPELASVSQELTTLRSVENVIGNLSAEGLAGAINQFFGAFRELAADPESVPLRQQAVWAARGLADRFRSVALAVESIAEHMALEARNAADETNGLLTEIGDLNGRIQELSARGVVDSNLLDLRDQAVAKLSDLVDVAVRQGEYESCTIEVMGVVVVLKTSVTGIEVGYADGQALGISVQGAHHYDTQARGGRLGALLALNNDIIPRIRDQLDALARGIMDQVNRCHVQGVGTDGSFTELEGRSVGAATLDQWDPPVVAGQVQLRLVNTATGEATRHSVTIAPSTQTIDDVAALFDAIGHLSASAPRTALHIQADTGWRFDFLPALTPEPTSSTLTGSAAPTISGLFTGASNETFTCTVVGTGDVGVTGVLTVEIRNAAGDLVRSLDVGQGYAAGDPLLVADGAMVSFSPGSLNDGEQFTIEALADTDPTGFLAAAGVNALFVGNSALTMQVTDGVADSPGRLATSLGTDGVDNLNVLRMADLADRPLDAAGGLTPADAYRRLVSDVGQWVAMRQAREEGLQSVMQQLQTQYDDLSGVDINDEAARLLLFERMFQSMARYLAVLTRAQDALMDVI